MPHLSMSVYVRPFKSVDGLSKVFFNEPEPLLAGCQHTRVFLQILLHLWEGEMSMCSYGELERRV